MACGKPSAIFGGECETGAMSFFLHTGDDLGKLAESLQSVIGKMRRGPIARIQVVVPTPEMGKWFEQWLAEKEGVCANIDFVLPQKFIHALMDSLLEPFENGEKFTKEAMTWWLWARLRELPEDPIFQPLRGYLDSDRNGRTTFDLARQLARLFDRYMVYRPELMSGNKPPSTHRWQWWLWEECVRESGGKNPSSRHFELLAKLRGGGVELKSGWPVIFFGHDTLAPSYMELLRALARHKEVRIFAWQPTNEAWDDLLSVREQWREAGKSGNPAACGFADGQSLLVGCGKIGRDYFKLLRGEENDITDGGDCFSVPKSGGALAVLQNAVRSAVQSGDRERAPATDESVQVHACHNPLREVEVLHDYLIECFAGMNELTSRDVLVMSPDIETYAPLIHAVFETEDKEEKPSRRIPVAISDRSVKNLSPLLGNFLSLLKRRGWKLAASDIMAILEMPAVRRRFDLDDEEVVRLREWCEHVGVAWGWDAAHKQRLGLPAEGQNTWRWALDRLLLGGMMEVEPYKMVAGIAPAADVRGDNVRAVGKLESLVATLHEFSEALSEARTLAQWSDWLREMEGRLLKTDREEAEEMRPFLDEIGRLPELGRCVGMLERLPVPAEVIHAYLESVLEPRAGGNYLSGPVTCCSLKPLRNVQARVICLLGLNDGEFPRRDVPLAFDWMAEHPREGDRTARDEDRYLFLQSVLAARERLFVSYVGHSESDERERAPSVLVGELLESLDACVEFRNDEKRVPVEVAVVRKHRLHPFSLDYFKGDGRFFSYSTMQAAAAGVFGKARSRSAPFVPEPLPRIEAGAVSLDDLIRFWSHPCQQFVEKRLRLTLRAREDRSDDDEPFSLDPLDQYKLRERLLKAEMDPAQLVKLREVGAVDWFRAEGRLPLGGAGAAFVSDLQGDVRKLAGRIPPGLPGDRVSFEREFSGVKLHGALTGLLPSGLFLPTASKKIDAKRQIQGWIQHLVLCATAADHGHDCVTTCAALEETFYFDIVQEAAQELETLLHHYLEGMSTPLAFFPESSMAYFKALSGKQGTPARAIDKARGKWEPTEFGGKAEGDDPYNALCFRHADPIESEAFGMLAHSVFSAMQANCRMEKVKND